MTEEQKEVFTAMCSAVGVSVEEMSIVLGIHQDDLAKWITDPDTEYFKIYNKEFILRKTQVLNKLMDAAIRDSPEAQKVALKIFERKEHEWQRLNL